VGGRGGRDTPDVHVVQATKEIKEFRETLILGFIQDWMEKRNDQLRKGSEEGGESKQNDVDM